MARLLIRHDLPLETALCGRRDDLEVLTTDTPDETLELLPEVDLFVTSPSIWHDPYLDVLDRVDWLQSTAAGYDAYPLDAFEDCGLRFTNASGNYGPVVAEHAFAMAFAFSRRLPQLLDAQREHTWDRSVGWHATDWKDSTLTVVGLGDIGECIAKRGVAFEMDVYGVKRHPDEYDGCVPADRVLAPDALPEVLPETDLLVTIVPLTDETHHLVDEEVLRALPESAYVVNVARGEVVDQAALVDALDANEIAGAGLDVFEDEPLPADSPLWDDDRVFVSPHVAGRSDTFVERFANLFLDNYDRWSRGEPLVNRIV